jgi:hypothetical protein
LTFVSGFWKEDAAWCCCGESVAGCLALIGWLASQLWIQWGFFLLSLGVNAVIVLAAWQRWIVGNAGIADLWARAGSLYGNDEIVGAPFRGNPTLAELLSHIETTYPSFWAIVAVPLEDPLYKLYVSSLVALAAGILLGFFGICIMLREWSEKVIA